MTWQNLNPTWEYRYSSASKRAEQVEAFSSELYKFYPFMDKVTQADLWRYIIVYQNGGVYSDMDAMCITSLDSVIKDIPKEIDIFGPKVNDDNTIYNANFGAVKNSICLEKVLDSILKRYKEIDLLGIIKAAEAVGGLSLSEAVEFQLNYGIFWYSLVLRENIDKVWTKYDGFIHMSDIKEPDWHPDYKVNYYGEHKSYLKLVEEHGWSLTRCKFKHNKVAMELIDNTLEEELLAKKIPKIIWQTHEWDYEDLPDNFKKAAMTWKNLNPTWDHKYVSADERVEQIKSFNNTLYQAYLVVNKVTQADIWRYVTLYVHGGNYSDMDSVCSMPLDYLIDSCPANIELIATPLDDREVVNNANFACKKESKILELILENIIWKYNDSGLMSMLNITKELNISISEAINYQLSLGPEDYSKIVLTNEEKVLFNYKSAIHGEHIKEADYTPEHVVNYYGNSLNYLYLAKENNWSLI